MPILNQQIQNLQPSKNRHDRLPLHCAPFRWFCDGPKSQICPKNAIFEIYFSQPFLRDKVYVAPFRKPHAKFGRIEVYDKRTPRPEKSRKKIIWALFSIENRNSANRPLYIFLDIETPAK